MELLNRATLYGDGMFETLRIANGKACFIGHHYTRVQASAEFIDIKHTSIDTFEAFKSLVNDYIINNKLVNARLRIQWSRLGTIGYDCTSTTCDVIINHVSNDITEYTLNDVDYTYTKYFLNVKACNIISNLKTTSALLYVLAGNFAKANNCDETLIFNEHKRVIEGYKSNVFIVKKGIVYTPKLTEGCIMGIMRSVIIAMCKTMGIKCIETELTLEHVDKADEIWFTNVMQGIRCVGKPTLATLITTTLNKIEK
jgi:branched-chain amino acid aminotransferase